MYCTVDQVRNVINVDSTIVSDAVITDCILAVQEEVDHITNTTYYPIEDNGSVTSATNTTLTDSSQTWTTDLYNTYYSVYIYEGTGKGQIRKIIDTTNDTLTVSSSWSTNPDTTSKFIVSYLNLITEKYDGNGSNTMFVDKMPIIQIDSLSISDTSITPSTVLIYETSKIFLTTSSEESTFKFDDTNKQNVNITYHYGILPIIKYGTLRMDAKIVKFTATLAGIKALINQMGGTYDDLSTFTLPDFSGSIGQAYVNIKGTLDQLIKDADTMKTEMIGKYTFMEV